MHITGVGIAAGNGAKDSGNRAVQFCLAAAAEARAQAGWESMSADDGLVLATTTGQYLLWENSFVECAETRTPLEDFRGKFLRQPLSDLALNVRSELGMTGPYSVVTSACTASTQALALATMWIREGRCRRVLVGGVEVLCTLTVEGFRSLQLLSATPSKPFDVKRSGITLAEGAGFLCLEKEGLRSLAKVSGFGFSTDGFHMTSPRPDGSGSARAMSRALLSANLKPGDVNWVHAHGTGSPANDVSEAAAIESVFGRDVPVSSTKGSHGHLLGASGAVETALLVRAMGEGKILGTLGFSEKDPAINVNVIKEDLKIPLKHVVKNTLGFGGANAALVLSC